MKWVLPIVRSRPFLRTQWCSQRACVRSLSSFNHSNLFHNQQENNKVQSFVGSCSINFEFVPPVLISKRYYAKGKDKKKEKGKNKVVVDERLLADLLPLEDLKKQMQKSVDHLKEEYIQTLSLRSSTGSIENLKVSFEGKDYLLQELGQVLRKDTKTIIINMVAFPQAILAVLKSLEKSGMNLNPQQDGTMLYIPVPRVTTEHRDQLAKNAKALFIKCRDAVKNVQIKYEKKLKNDSSLAQDDVFSAQQQLGTIAGDYIATADTMLQTKLQELQGKASSKI